uniref:Retinol dehydrogenase 13 n=1 Tax=Bos mutus grunniens TaxID=30521 RepID=A0A8B9XQZ4_BOSMU
MSRYVLPLSVLGTAVGGAVLLKDFVAGGACPSKATIPGKTVIVTGANTGIGKQTALELAKRGGNIILACRDMEKCEAAAKEIRGETLNHRVNARHLDLASLKSIREFAAKVTEEEEHVHILINNAAVMRCPHWTTEDGFEMQLGVNYLGHFLLTNLLLDKLKASAPSRIINVSSLAHVAGHIDFEDLNWEKRKYDTKAAYCQSKLAVVVSTKELSRRLQGTGVTVNALHPGVARTELGRHTGMHSSAFSSFTLESPYCTEELVFQATSRTDPHCSPSNSQAGSFPAEPSGKPCGRKAGLCGGPVSHLRGRKITAGNPQVTHAQPGRRAGGWRHCLCLAQAALPFCRAGDTVSAAGGLRPGGAVRGAAVLGGLRAAHRHVPGRPSSAR